MRTALKIIPFALIFLGCEVKNKQPEFHWLVGTWASQDEEATFTEKWQFITNSGNLLGNGYVVSGGDTVFQEFLYITDKDGKWYYQAQIPNQNDGEPVYFEAKKTKQGYALFANLMHDFPQTIEYKLMPDSSLQILLSGVKNEVQITDTLLLSQQPN